MREVYRFCKDTLPYSILLGILLPFPEKHSASCIVFQLQKGHNFILSEESALKEDTQILLHNACFSKNVSCDF